MSKLKPIGSEKLQGTDKLNRMLEIAMYNEVDKVNLNETSSKEYNIQLTDGYVYAIVKEKIGYVIKKGLNESALDYIEPMRNRKHYRSYSQAFKKLNLITKELNDIYDNPNGVSLFGEQKKYTLKTPKPAPVEDDAPPAPPAEPPSVPAPALPPSPLEGGDMPNMGDDMPEMGGEMPNMGDDMGGEMPDMGDDMPDMEDETPSREKGDEKITFRGIQKLTGKLTQKLRALESEEGLTSEEIKYVINMVISSVNIETLDEEDLDDIMSKFEGGEDMGDDMGDMEDEMGGEMPDMGGEMPDMGDEMGGEMPDMGDEMGGEMPGMGDETYAPRKKFNESKVDSILSKYFELSPNEKALQEQRQRNAKRQLNENLKSAKILSETNRQFLTVESFLNKYKKFKVEGKTNLGNIILKLNENTVKITKKGEILK